MCSQIIHTRINDIFKIQYPIIQAGMVWASGWKLASAVSNAGGLGIIGAGSMSQDILREHIKKCKTATANPFAVNLPLLYRGIDKQVQIIIDENVPIVFTSAGNPTTWTKILKGKGIKVAHVVSSSKFAIKAEDAGCDAVVAEGFEAGGHNGREETTTMVLVPLVAASVKIPVIAAGGIANGAQMLAAFALGAEAAQIGSRFVASKEASSHINFKQAITGAKEGDTQLSLKKVTPVRLLKNDFFDTVNNAEQSGASVEALVKIIGKGRARKGMFDGDLADGELEIGQVSALIKDIPAAAEIVKNILKEFDSARGRLCLTSV